MICPCGSEKNYEDCCQPYIKGTSPAPTPEALMRSRYTAHVVAEIPYLRESLAPEKRGDFDETEVRKWATGSEWLGLEVIEASERHDRGKVEFIARYRVSGGELSEAGSAPKTVEYHEIAKFRKDMRRGLWYFVDGKAHAHEEGEGKDCRGGVPTVKPIRVEPKIGRNDPCSCGSGKKYKKCCGAA